jgi:hypothetical protein
MPKTDIEWLEYVNEFHFSHHPEINIAIHHGSEALEKINTIQSIIKYSDEMSQNTVTVELLKQVVGVEHDG